MSSSDDLVARWKVPLKGKVHTVEFEHGAALTGKRVVFLDGTPVVRKDFMFNLVGSEPFRISGTKCCVNIESDKSIWEFKYTLTVDGNPLESHMRETKTRTRIWLPKLQGKLRRVVLETGDLSVYVDGQKVDTTGEFLDEDEEEDQTKSHVTGSAQHFLIDNALDCRIKITSSGSRLHGLQYELYIGDERHTAPEDQMKAMATQRND